MPLIWAEEDTPFWFGFLERFVGQGGVHFPFAEGEYAHLVAGAYGAGLHHPAEGLAALRLSQEALANARFGDLKALELIEWNVHHAKLEEAGITIRQIERLIGYPSILLS